MGNIQIVLALFILSFAIDFSLHKFIFPTLRVAPKEPEAQTEPVKNETELEVEADSETETENDQEEEPINPKGVSVQDENGKEVPINSSHALDDSSDTEEPAKPKPKAGKKFKGPRKGNFNHVNVHIKLCAQCNYMKHYESISKTLVMAITL